MLLLSSLLFSLASDLLPSRGSSGLRRGRRACHFGRAMAKKGGKQLARDMSIAEDIEVHVPLQAVVLADSFTQKFRPITLEKPKVMPAAALYFSSCIAFVSLGFMVVN